MATSSSQPVVSEYINLGDGALYQHEAASELEGLVTEGVSVFAGVDAGLSREGSGLGVASPSQDDWRDGAGNAEWNQFYTAEQATRCVAGVRTRFEKLKLQAKLAELKARKTGSTASEGAAGAGTASAQAGGEGMLPLLPLLPLSDAEAAAARVVQLPDYRHFRSLRGVYDLTDVDPYEQKLSVPCPALDELFAPFDERRARRKGKAAATPAAVAAGVAACAVVLAAASRGTDYTPALLKLSRNYLRRAVQELEADAQKEAQRHASLLAETHRLVCERPSADVPSLAEYAAARTAELLAVQRISRTPAFEALSGAFSFPAVSVSATPWGIATEPGAPPSGHTLALVRRTLQQGGRRRTAVDACPSFLSVYLPGLVWTPEGGVAQSSVARMKCKYEAAPYRCNALGCTYLHPNGHVASETLYAKHLLLSLLRTPLVPAAGALRAELDALVSGFYELHAALRLRSENTLDMRAFLHGIVSWVNDNGLARVEPAWGEQGVLSATREDAASPQPPNTRAAAADAAMASLGATAAPPPSAAPMGIAVPQPKRARLSSGAAGAASPRAVGSDGGAFSAVPAAAAATTSASPSASASPSDENSPATPAVDDAAAAAAATGAATAADTNGGSAAAAAAVPMRPRSPMRPPAGQPQKPSRFVNIKPLDRQSLSESPCPDDDMLVDGSESSDSYDDDAAAAAALVARGVVDELQGCKPATVSNMWLLHCTLQDKLARHAGSDDVATAVLSAYLATMGGLRLRDVVLSLPAGVGKTTAAPAAPVSLRPFEDCLSLHPTCTELYVLYIEALARSAAAAASAANDDSGGATTCRSDALLPSILRVLQIGLNNLAFAAAEASLAAAAPPGRKGSSAGAAGAHGRTREELSESLFTLVLLRVFFDRKGAPALLESLADSVLNKADNDNGAALPPPLHEKHLAALPAVYASVCAGVFPAHIGAVWALCGGAPICVDYAKAEAPSDSAAADHKVLAYFDRFLKAGRVWADATVRDCVAANKAGYLSHARGVRAAFRFAVSEAGKAPGSLALWKLAGDLLARQEAGRPVIPGLTEGDFYQDLVDSCGQAGECDEHFRGTLAVLHFNALVREGRLEDANSVAAVERLEKPYALLLSAASLLLDGRGSEAAPVLTELGQYEGDAVCEEHVLRELILCGPMGGEEIQVWTHGFCSVLLRACTRQHAGAKAA